MPLNLLGNLLKKSLQKAGIEQEVEAAVILEQYSKKIVELFGEKIHQHVRPLYLRNGVLRVACLSSIVAQELKFKEEEILQRLNRNKSTMKVKRISYIS